MSSREAVRTSRKWFSEALQSRAKLSSLGGILKGFPCFGWVWEEQLDVSREREASHRLAAPGTGVSGILECEEVLTGSQEGPGPQPSCQSLSLEPGSRYRGPSGP